MKQLPALLLATLTFFCLGTSGLAWGAGNPCYSAVPKGYKLTESRIDSEVYQIPSPPVTMSVSCMRRTSVPIGKAITDLKAAANVGRIERLSATSYYFDMNEEGALSRTYVFYQTSHVLQISFISHGNAVKDLGFTRAIAEGIAKK